jgi:lysophospholipase L1-like esterase
MKTLKYIFLIICCAVLFITAQSQSFIICAANEQQKTYIAFGDSITAGYGVGADNSYAKLFADDGGYSLTNYAVSGWDSGDLLTLLGGGTIAAETLQNTDLITVCIGANDLLKLLTPLAGDFAAVTNIGDLAAIAETLQSSAFINQIFTAIKNFGNNFIEIRAKLPADTIYFTIYNPYSGINLGLFNFGLYCDVYIEQLNNIIRGSGAKVFDLYGTFATYKGTQPLVAADFTAMPVNPDPHPTLAGQQYTAEQFGAWLQQENNHKNNDDNTARNKLPWWAITLICVGGAAAAGGIIFIIIKRKQKQVEI